MKRRSLTFSPLSWVTKIFLILISWLKWIFPISLDGCTHSFNWLYELWWDRLSRTYQQFLQLQEWLKISWKIYWTQRTYILDWAFVIFIQLSFYDFYSIEPSCEIVVLPAAYGGIVSGSKSIGDFDRFKASGRLDISLLIGNSSSSSSSSSSLSSFSSSSPASSESVWSAPNVNVRWSSDGLLWPKLADFPRKMILAGRFTSTNLGCNSGNLNFYPENALL